MNLIACPSCAKMLKAAGEVLGKRVRCPSCGTTFVAADTTAPGAGTEITDKREAPRGDDRQLRETSSLGAEPKFMPTGARNCPNCGSDESRKMTKEETLTFYGGASLVVRRPRKCLSCDHGWEPTPSRFACAVMMCVAFLLCLAMLPLCLFFIWFVVKAPQNAKNAWQSLQMIAVSFVWFVACGGIAFVAMRAFKKYRKLWQTSISN